MNKFPLLIGGCPRSGTTALLQIINSNPSVFISSEENLIKLAETLDKTLGTKERRGKSLKNGMRALSKRETLSEENIHSHNFSTKSVWPTVRYIYKFHHRQMHGDAELILWGDKYPNYCRDMDALLKLSQVRYLHLTRNPLDTINSMLRRTEMASAGRDWWKALTDFDSMLDAWTSAYQAIRKVEKRDNILHLHYEDLVFDFTNSVKRMNEFAGVDLEYQNILVSDPALHFERDFLTPEIRDRILAHPAVKEYAENAPAHSRMA